MGGPWLWLVLWIGVTVGAALLGKAWVAALAGVGGGLLLRSLRRDPAPVERPANEDGLAGERRGALERTAAEFLAAALSALPDAVLVLDAADRVLVTNAGAAELLRLPVEAAGNGPPRSLAAAVDWPQLAAALQACRSGRGPQSFEAAPRRVGDVDRTLEVRVAAVGDAGLGVVVLRDVSRLRQLESHRRDFVANVSHELKTPLAAIQGFVETLLDDPDVPAPTRQRFLEKVQRQVERLATLVADLLTLSRLDDHAPQPADPCDLGGITRDVGRDLQPLAERRSVRLALDLPAASVWVAAEREALRQVVSNLVDNAIKYTPGGGSVTVRLVPDRDRAELLVVDTGIGLSETDRERVFERFYRVDRARSRELGGTGLGLSIVKNTVQGLGGEIGVHSRLGQGSTFWVRLPVTPPE